MNKDMKAYIESLEAAGQKMTEDEWRDIIEKEVEDIEKQTGEEPDIDIDEVIRELELDDFIRNPICGTVFYDESNGRYITPDGVGSNPKVFSCVVEEFDENGELEVTSRQLFTLYELQKFEVKR